VPSVRFWPIVLKNSLGRLGTPEIVDESSILIVQGMKILPEPNKISGCCGASGVFQRNRPIVDVDIIQ
jgi:hypothetical protein